VDFRNLAALVFVAMDQTPETFTATGAAKTLNLGLMCKRVFLKTCFAAFSVKTANRLRIFPQSGTNASSCVIVSFQKL
jgi:hypothetical protein